MKDASCSLHQREATATCTRFGVFLCDWCVKLAPTWSIGLCAECMKRVPWPDTRLLTLPRLLNKVFALGVAAMLVAFGVLALSLVSSAVREHGWSSRAGVMATIGLGLVIVGAERARRVLRSTGR